MTTIKKGILGKGWWLVAMIAAGCASERIHQPEATTKLSDRPQHPVPPFPYTAIEVRFPNPRAGLELAGTLTIPSSRGPHPAMVLVTGAGPQDRDETIARHKPFLVLADYLTRRGIAVLRFDDRGVGESKGDFATATMRDFASDARAAVESLHARADIDSRRIGLAGHSEGGMVAPMAALEMPGQVACLVLLASPGLRGEEIFYLQDAAEARAQGTSEVEIERRRQRKEQQFAVLKAEPDLDKAAEKLRQVMKAIELTPEEQAAIAAAKVNIDAAINQQIRLLNNAATRLFLTYDPLPALARVEVPVLALTGERDLQVPPNENIPLVTAALKNGRCADYQVREMPGLNHLFQRSETGLPRDYARIKETFAPEALEAIGDWVLKRLH